MSENFDPYYKWLGIPPKDQPPHHYRLLGLERLESDAEVIDAAANRLMEYLQGMAVGSHLAQSQALLNEISTARLCLLDPKKKAAYDKQLQAEQAAAEQVRGTRRLRGQKSPAGSPSPPPTGPPSAPRPFEISTDPQEGSASHGESPAHRAPRKQPPWAGIIALVIGLLVVSGLAVYVIFYRNVNTDARDSNRTRALRPPGRLTPEIVPESPFKDPSNNPDRRPPVVDPPPLDPPDQKTPEKKTPEKKTPEPAPDLAELFTSALAAIEKKDVKEAKRLLEKYLEDPDAPKLLEARGLLDALFKFTSDKFALTQLALMTEQQLDAAANGTLQIPKVNPPALRDILLDTLRKNVPEARRLRALRKKPKDKPPKKTDPPKSKSNPKPKPSIDPNANPKEFLQSKSLTQQGAFWILEEGPLVKRVSSLAKLAKTYRAASNKLAVALKNLNKVRTQLKKYKREAERLQGLGRQPPVEIVQFINKWNPKVGSDQAIAANVDFRNLILAKIKALDDLAIPVLKLKKEMVSMEEAYQRLAADPQVVKALSKLAGKIRYRLGPSSGFKPTLAKFKKYEAILMTDEVPFYLQERDTLISAVLNENTPLVFKNMPTMDSNLIPGAMLKKAGIVVDPAAVRVELRISFGDGKVRKIACRRITIPAIRFGRHVLKDLEFLVTPPEAADLGAALGGSVFDDYRVEADLDKFVFKIRPRNEAVEGKQKP